MKIRDDKSILNNFLNEGTISENHNEIEKLFQENPLIQEIFESEIAGSDDNINIIRKKNIYSKIISKINLNNGSSKSSFLKDKRFEKTANPNLIFKKTIRWAAILLLPIISSVLTYQISKTSATYYGEPVTLTTGNGEKAEITLPDGSRAWLNSGSSLTYNSSYNVKSRELNLNGEAYFEVVPNKDKAFIVNTNDIVIEALGTSFNVTAYDDDLFVSSILIDGSIQVRADDQERTITENHRVTYFKASNTLASDVVVATDYIMWKDGFLYFDNNSFEEIAHKLTRMFNVKIEFHSDELRTIKFTGTLGNSSIKNVLDILSLTSPMHYEMNGTAIELYHKNNL